MGDPSEFRIKKGANPHTRSRWGCRKHVDQGKAKEQWLAMREILTRYGLVIHVLPPRAEYPGLVFPANAGYMVNADSPLMASERKMVLSNLNPSRSGEEQIYEDCLRRLGLQIQKIHSAFEGEADLIRCGDDYLFTYGELVKPGWVPRKGIPPWKRRYGFRSAHHAIHELAHWVPPRHVVSLQLIDECFYHGDTVLCSFGPERRYLLVYEKAIAPVARRFFHEHSSVLFLDDRDAAAFAANSFNMQYKGQEILFMPAGVSGHLVRHIEALDVQVVKIDVSEFLEKGGGAVKCMIGDLGLWQSTSP